MKKVVATLLAALMLLTMLPMAGIAAQAGEWEAEAVAAQGDANASYPQDDFTESIADFLLQIVSDISAQVDQQDLQEALAAPAMPDNAEEAVAPTKAVGNAVALAAEGTYEDFKYQELEDGTAEITDYTGSATELDIPSEINGYQVTSIGDYAFDNCTFLTNITIPNSITGIGDGAFRSCATLANITIPNSVTNIGTHAFYRCISLTDITVETENERYADLEGVLYNKEQTELIYYPLGKKATSYSIPNGVTNIGISAFSSCTSLISITIPDSVTGIDSNAFSGCTSLTKIVIPDSVTSIGYGAFFDCASLTNVTISNGVTSIGSSAFSGCTSLANITIPNSVTNIGDYAFYRCTSLTDITVDAENEQYADLEGILYNKEQTVILYYPMGKNEPAYAIPNSVTNIGARAFSDCESLTEITIPDSVTTIESEAFSGCFSLTSITLPNSILRIEERAFYGCTSLVSVTIPDSVTDIEEGAFENCSSLANVKLGSGLIRLGTNSFSGTDITEIVIPKSVTTMSSSWPILSGGSPFTGANKLKKVVFEDGISAVPSWAFEDCASVEEVIIPVGVKIIGSHSFIGCTGLKNITIPDSVTSIGAYAFRGCDGLKNITIPDGVTTIGAYAFAWCSIPTNIQIPNSVTSIGRGTFSHCTSLVSIAIPDGVKSIERGAFDGCTSLISITIPNSVTDVGDFAFRSTSLASITLPSGVTGIGYGAFQSCHSLTSITIPDGVTSIEQLAFDACTSLTNITLPNGVTSIGRTAFSGCTSLTNITLPNGVTSIGDYAFYRCTSLASITIPNSVTSIDTNAFRGCDSLSEIHYGGSQAQWYEIAIQEGNDALMNATIHYNTTLEELSQKDFINEHYNFANSQSFVSFKDENLARSLSDSFGGFKKFWYDTMSMNWFNNYYDVVISEVLSSATVRSAVADYLSRAASSEVRSIAKDLIDTIQTLDGTNQFSDDDMMKILLSFKPSDFKGTPVYQYMVEVFGKHSGKIIGAVFETFGYLDNLFTIVGAAGDVLEGMVNCMNYAAAITAYANSSIEFKQIVKESAAQANGGLKTALSRFAEIDHSEDVDSMAKAFTKKCQETGSNIQLQIFIDLFGDKIIAGLGNFVYSIAVQGGTLGTASLAGTTGGAVASGILSGVSLGMTISNLGGNLSSVTYYTSSIEKGAEFADVVWVVLTAKEQNLRENKTLLNARLFDEAFNLYKGIQLVAIKNALAAVKEHDDGFFRKLFGKKEDISWLVSAQCEYHNIKCHRGNYDIDSFSGGTKGIVVACPVDVLIYSNGTLCAQIVDNKETIWDERISAAVIGDVKYISVPSEKWYQLEIRATDIGTMDYTIFENGSYGSAQRMISTEDIPLQTGQTFTGNIPIGEQIVPEHYCLTTDSETVPVDWSGAAIPASEVKLSDSRLCLTAGQSAQLLAEVLPEDTTDKTLIWVSDNEEVAQVNALGNVVAVSPGEAVVYAIGQQYIYAACFVTVEEISAQGVTLNQSEAQLAVNDTLHLIATITPDNASNPSVLWASSHPEIASVNEHGNVTAVTPGTAVITATTADGGYTASCTVTVIAPTLTLTLDGQAVEGDVAYAKLPSILTMYKNHSATLGFTLDPSVEIQSVKWSYANWSVSNPEANIESPNSAETVIRPNDRGIGARSTWVTLTVTDVDGNVYQKTVKVRFYKFSWQRK